MAMREPGGLTETDICNRAIDLAGGQRQGIIDDSSEESITSLCINSVESSEKSLGTSISKLRSKKFHIS